MNETVVLAVLFFGASVLYTSVGHAGASGYLAAMAIVGVAPDSMKPTALVLNVLVSVLTTTRYVRAGLFSWRVLWPFALGSVPLAFVGGALPVPGSVFKLAVAGVLAFSAVRMFASPPANVERTDRVPPVWAGVVGGAFVGLLAGLTGTGGGIFLSPLLLFAGWGDIRRNAGVSSAFILVNSLAGLAGSYSTVQSLPANLPVLAVAVVLGGILGTELGTRRLPPRGLQVALAAVLVIAAGKLVMAALG